MTTPDEAAVQLRLFDEAGQFVCLLQDWEEASCQEELNAPGAWSIKYPREGRNAGVLAATLSGQVGFLVEGNEIYRGLLENDGNNDADPMDAFDVSGRGLLAILDQAVVYPPNGAGTLPALRIFNAASPGTILGVLLSQAKTRGGLAGLTWTFDALVDSAGASWTQTMSVQYDAGISYLKVAEGMVGQGVVELRAVGKPGGGIELQAYRPSSVLDRDLPKVVVHLGREGKALPRQRSRRELASHVLVLGDEGVNAERGNATTAATWGRREISLSQGNTIHQGTMAVLGDSLLTQRSRPMQGRTLVYDLAARDETDATPTPRPWVDYRPGDRIRLAGVRLPDNTLEPLRVQSCAASFTADGMIEPSIELGDLFVEATVRLQRRIDGIVNGTVVTTSGAAPPIDKLSPAAPGQVAITSSAYLTPDGQTRSQASISWLAVTTNSDGTPITDLAGYLVSSMLGAQGWTAEMQTSAPEAFLDGLPPGASLTVRVRAYDRADNRSTYSVSQATVTGADSTPPPVPSTPTSSPVVGGFRIAWNGRGSANEVMPADLAYIEVHTSTGGATFETTTATLRDTILRSGGTSLLAGDPYDITHWTRLVAVDLSGNRSAPSSAVSSTPRRVSGLDVEALAIATTNLAADAVTAVKIAAGAVGEAKVATDAITAAKIAGSAVTSVKIADAAIVTAKIADAAIVTAKIGDAAIVAAKIGDAQIVNAKIADLAVSAAKIGDAQILRAKIADLAVDDAKIANLNVGKLVTGILQADMTVSSRIKTADAGARVELNAAGLSAFDAGGARTVHISSTGSATFRGDITGSTINGFIPRGPQIGVVSGDGAYNVSDIRVWKTASGQVQMSGEVFVTRSPDSSFNPIFTLPVGYRPDSVGQGGVLRIPVVRSDQNIWIIAITLSGIVRWQTIPTAVAAGGGIGFGVVSFYAA